MEEIKMGIDRKTYRLREESLARKRNQEYQKQLFWNGMTNYYKTWDVQASKYNNWASQPQTPKSTQRDEKSEEQCLEERRIKLANLLSEEHLQYEKELKEIMSTKCNVKSTRPVTEELTKIELEMRSREEEARRHEADIQKYKQWKTVNPLIRNSDRKKYQESMKKCWTEQMKQKQIQKENERKLALKLEEETARRRKAEEEMEKDLAYKKKGEMKALQSHLLKQIEEVKKRDEMTKQIKLQELQEIKLKQDLEKIAVERNQTEKQRRSRELFSFLRHQYQLQLKQRTKQIQEELKEDQRFIEEVTKCLEQEHLENTKIREDARKEIDRANIMLKEFSRIEKQREKEMEFIFFEEAKKLWHKQEAQWNSEKEARNNLMRDVLMTVQKQIKEKLQRNAEQHKSLTEEKEELLKSIETMNVQLKEAEEEANKKKEKYRVDLEKQILEKQMEKQLILEEERKESNKELPILSDDYEY